MLTKRQNELLSFLRARAAAGPVSPSFEEMAAHLGLKSKSGPHRLIVGLETRGFIRRKWHGIRAIEVLPDPSGERREAELRVIEAARNVTVPGDPTEWYALQGALAALDKATHRLTGQRL